MLVKSRLVYARQLPHPSQFDENCLFIFDRRLPLHSPEFRRWIKKMPHVYGVRAGESLKEIDHFAAHARKILAKTRMLAPQKMRVVTVGGGSVSDFGGFVASVLKRGVPVVHIPSTWLAAIDSAHGGKTALNVAGSKNQIGTFHSAETIYLVRSLLNTQPQVRAEQAYGELAKIALIDGRRWTLELKGSKLKHNQLMWRFLRPAIEAKYRIVERDPLDKKGIRAVLNLGHTLGHVLESSRMAAHGEAVSQGLYFALKWSLQRQIISLKDYFQCVQLLSSRLQIASWQEINKNYKPLAARAFENALYLDKKRTSNEKLQFVFLRKWGRPLLMKVSYAEVVREARRQGWTR